MVGRSLLFREGQPRLEAATAADGRGNQGQAAAVHHTVDDGEPKTPAGANR